VKVLDRERGELDLGGRPSASAVARSRTIEISLRNGRSLKVSADIDLRMLTSLIVCVETA
jgi:transposase